MALTLIAAATETPVSLEEAKSWCRVDGAADDAVLQMLIATAVGMVEDFTGLALGRQTWGLVLDDFADEMELLRGPVISVSSITYRDTGGAEQTLEASVYVLDAISNPQRVVRDPDASWPTADDGINTVSITFVTGYAALPAQIQLSILMLVGQWYDNRVPGDMPVGVVRLLSPFRRIVI